MLRCCNGTIPGSIRPSAASASFFYNEKNLQMAPPLFFFHMSTRDIQSLPILAGCGGSATGDDQTIELSIY